MDLKLHRPHASCAHTGRPLVSGELFYSCLVRSKGKLDRIDCCSEAWQGPPEQTLAWWRSLYATPEAGGSSLAPPDVLLDVLEQLEDKPEDAALRYLVALQLVRRKVLRILDRQGLGHGAKLAPSDQLVLACRKRDTQYNVQVVVPQGTEAVGLEERLSSLLWSGGAA
jgi:hypothetical protein